MRAEVNHSRTNYSPSTLNHKEIHLKTSKQILLLPFHSRVTSFSVDCILPAWLDVPQDSANSRNVYLDNSELVFRKDVTLIADAIDKDADGCLLRYVLVGDTFVNLQLLQDGRGNAVDVPPNSSCAQAFRAAEESAKQSALGLWATPVP